jgi:hypothetical protein
VKVRRIDFYPDDWIGGVYRLTDAERGVYIQVLMGIYSHGGPIHIDDARALCGRHFHRALTRLLALSKLTQTEQYLDNNRAATELYRSRNRTISAQQNGAKGRRPNGLAEPGGFNEPRAPARTTHQSSIINHHLRGQKNGFEKEERQPSRPRSVGKLLANGIPSHFPNCACPACEQLRSAAAEEPGANQEVDGSSPR